MKFHPEVLGALQKRALHALGPVLCSNGFYLAGGTAVALWLGHRRSVDFDWFTPHRFEDPLGLARELRNHGASFVTTRAARGTLEGRVGGVRTSLLEFRYPLLKPLVSWPSFRCSVSSLEDLAAMKLSALAQRGHRKDFVDLFFLASGAFSLEDMLECYQRKFAVTDLAHLLTSLTYFKDADRNRMPAMLRPTNWRSIKKAFQRWVREMLKE